MQLPLTISHFGKLGYAVATADQGRKRILAPPRTGTLVLRYLQFYQQSHPSWLTQVQRRASSLGYSALASPLTQRASHAEVTNMHPGPAGDDSISTRALYVSVPWISSPSGDYLDAQPRRRREISADGSGERRTEAPPRCLAAIFSTAVLTV